MNEDDPGDPVKRPRRGHRLQRAGMIREVHGADGIQVSFTLVSASGHRLASHCKLSCWWKWAAKADVLPSV